MACYMALVDLSPSEFMEVSEIFRRYGSSLGDAGATHGAGAPRGTDARAHLTYFNGGGAAGSRNDAMTGYYHTIRRENFQKLTDWILDGDRYKRVRNLTETINSLAILEKPDEASVVESYISDWPDPFKVEIYPRYF